jgi:hypothetical protein
MIDLVFDKFADEQFQLVYRSWLISEVPEGFKNHNATNLKNQGGSSTYLVQKREIVTESKVIYLSWRIKNLLNLWGLGK